MQPLIILGSVKVMVVKVSFLFLNLKCVIQMGFLLKLLQEVHLADILVFCKME